MLKVPLTECDESLIALEIAYGKWIKRHEQVQLLLTYCDWSMPKETKRNEVNEKYDILHQHD